MATFRIGDRVRYVGNTRGEIMSNSYVGRTGVVSTVNAPIGDSQSVRLTWDDDGTNSGGVYAFNVELVTSPNEIERALAVLRAAGEVTFTPRRPPFEVIKIAGVGMYDARVTENHVEVGCQTIEFDKVDEIAAAVAKAREYAKG